MYLLKDEDIPIRRTQSKLFMQKVMFLCEVEKPRQNHITKMGCFPLIEENPAKRNSKNRNKQPL